MHACMHGARMARENTAYSTRVAIRCYLQTLYPTVVYTRSIQVYKSVMLGYTGGRARGCAGNRIRARGSGVIRRGGSHIRAMSATSLPSTSFAQSRVGIGSSSRNNSGTCTCNSIIEIL